MNMPESIQVKGGPISLVFSKTGRSFFSERNSGNIWEIIDDENNQLIKHFQIPIVAGRHETGLLGITLDPEFEKNSFIYAFVTEGKSLKTSTNKVIRFSISDNQEKVLITIPSSRIHNGGIIAFGPDGKLYIGVGVDNPIKEKSQDKKYLGGKVLRINSDGSIPKDNPFPDSPVYSLGHRNVFGLTSNPKNGKLYISDVGPDNDDEINIIEAGGNYGWPEVVGYSNNPNFIDPIITYTPVITPTQMAFYNNYLYFGSYNEGSVHKLVLSDDGEKVISDTIVYRGDPFGVVGVFVSPDKEFFIATNDRIVKIKLNSVKERSVKNSMEIWVVAVVVALAIVIGSFVVLK